MRSANGRPIPREEAGFALIEVLISAVIIVLASGATFGLLSASAHSSAEERHRSEAFGLAQEDQARLRALPISSLNRLNETRTVTLNGNPFTIESEGEYINNKTGTSSCGQGTSSADYIQITSTVTWRSLGSRKPAEIQSIVAPPPGSLNPENGTLTISADNAAEAPISGIGLSGTGAGTFSGTTDSEGCAVFANQAAGNYTLTPSGVATGLVEQNGNPPGPQTVSVIAGSTSTVQLLYDRPGSIPIKFTAILGGILKESEADSAVVFNTGMTTAKTFGTIGTPKRELEAKSLFPFTSPDTVYAGSCEGDNPNPEDETNPPDAAALASVIIPPGGPSPTAMVQLPVLNLNVWSGSGSSSPGTRVKSAHVIVSDTKCPAKRTYTTEASGIAATSIALPWSTYEVCADNGSGGTSHKQASTQAVQNLTSTGTTVNLYLGATGLARGPCT